MTSRILNCNLRRYFCRTNQHIEFGTTKSASSDKQSPPSPSNNQTQHEGLSQECREQIEQMEKLKSDNEMLTDKYKRALADMENLRKRTQRQIEEAKLFAIQPFCKDLLEVADVLDLALNSLEKVKTEDGAASLDSGVHKGIKMTKEVLLKTFKKHGLVPVKPEGQKFDPNLHEAVYEISKDQSNRPAGHIAHVLNIGYSLHDRPIRPAKVGVVKME
ncbi:hypothetical protein niasHS_010320 [Heterodera schachtii]|uniref:GrpE protein homolog n=2 Tax=Heterodera TaxID=34509 RepID=A0ABD2J0Z9_HETSC